MSSYYFYAANKASENFVSTAVRMLLLSSGKVSLWLFILTTNIKIPVTQGLQFLKKKRFWFISLPSAQKKNSKNCLKYLAAPSTCVSMCWADHCTMIDTISCLPDDYNNYGFSRTFPRLCQEWAKNLNAFLIIYNEHKQRQTKYRFFYFCHTNSNIVQNAAARVVTRTRKYDHIKPVLKQLHWLPVSQRKNTRSYFWPTKRSTARPLVTLLNC